MNRKIYLLLVCVLLTFFGLSTLLMASPPTKYAQAAMPFLQIDVGSRVGMGGTQLGIVGDAEAMFANPAAMAGVEKLDLFASTTNWIADIKHYAVGAAYNAGPLGIFGVNAVFMDYGDFKKTIPYNVEKYGFDADLLNKGYFDLGTFTVSEYAVGISYARQITSQFYVGGNLKYASQDLGSVDIIDPVSGDLTSRGNKINNLLFDLGTLYYPGWKDLRFGVSFRNFANQSNYFDQRMELPLTFDFGVAMDLLTLSQSDEASLSDHKLTLALDWLHPRDYDERQHVGLEYSFLETFFLRGGYKINYDEAGWTAGVGFKKDISGAGLKVDFVYQDFGIFDSVSRISVGLFLK